MKHILPPLPYALDALEPVLSAETLRYHHGVHLQNYLNKLNALTVDSFYENMELEEIICSSTGAVFNNAAQAWNHIFYFSNLSPYGGSVSGVLASRLTTDFGSIDDFRDRLVSAAVNVFGSGWAWLVVRPDGILDVVTTANADNPLTVGQRPLLAIDVWEHAYYIDYRHRRDEYVKALWSLIDWTVVENRLAAVECNVYF